MPVVAVTAHPAGLHPLQAVKAHHKWKEEGISLDQIISEGEIVNLQGEVPGRTCLHVAIRRVADMSAEDYLPKSRYANCGRRKELQASDVKKVVGFVKKLRCKRFCTCRYIRRELKLHVSCRTINRVLNDNGFYWRKVPRIQGLS